LLFALDPPPQQIDDDLALELPFLLGEEPNGGSVDLRRECESGGGENGKRSVMGRRDECESDTPLSTNSTQLSRRLGLREEARVRFDGELDRSSRNFLIVDDGDGLSGE